MLRDSRRRPFARGRVSFPRGDRAEGARAHARLRHPRAFAANERRAAVRRQPAKDRRRARARPEASGADRASARLGSRSRRDALRRRTRRSRCATSGAAILYFSSELEEVLDVADRVAVMADGQFARDHAARQCRSRADRPLDVRPGRMTEAAPPDLRAGAPRAVSIRFVAAEGIGLRIVVAVVLSLVCIGGFGRPFRTQSACRFRGDGDGRGWLAASDGRRAQSGDALSAGRGRASPSAFAPESSTSAPKARSLSAASAPRRSRFTGRVSRPGPSRPRR